MEKSVESIVALKKQHDDTKAKYRHSAESPSLLSDFINPIILKLTKEDSSGIAGLGPVYSPTHS
jgi:hypothetical protein